MLYRKYSIILTLTSLILMFSSAQAHQEQTEAVLNHHLQSFGAGDVSAIMADYTENSVVVLPNGVLRGKSQIKGLFEALVTEFGKPGVIFNLTNTTLAGDIAYITWNAETPDNSYKYATDTYVVKRGKIAYQTVAFDVVAKN